MSWLTRHPGDRVLNRFADGELGEREHARVASHLAACPRCREEVGLVRRMGQIARTIPTPIATDEVLRRALARRAAGERVLLPMSDAGAPARPRTHRFAPAAIAAMLTLMVASLVVSVRVLEADRPALRIHPERPGAGEVLRVEYHGGALFADQSHLALRARYRTAGDTHWQLLAGVLVRGDDGRYRTEVELPDSVVYAAFAVEDLHGDRLDSNNRELWDVMVHEDGRPTLNAMTARLRDLERRDWGEAYEVAREMTELYPDAPQSWAIRFSFELSLFDRDSVRAAYQLKYHDLERGPSAVAAQDAAQVAWLASLAAGLGEQEDAIMWAREAVAQAPNRTVTAEANALALAVTLRQDLPALLGRLEEGWSRVGGGSLAIANMGLQAAIEAGDPAAALRWLQRYTGLRPGEGLEALPRAYLIANETDGAALRSWITDHILGLAETQPGLRPLRIPSDLYARQQAETAQRSLAALAQGLAENGAPIKAGEFARLAADLAWESGALLQIHDVLEAGGGMDLSLLSRAAADPMSAKLARARTQALSGAELRSWEADVEAARAELRDYVLESAVVRYPDRTARVVGPEGPILLRDLLGKEGTVVAFLSRYCAPALEEIPRLDEVAKRVGDRGGEFIVIATDSDRELQAHLREGGADVTLYVDVFGDARQAFGTSSAPDYFVLDADGRVRFEHSRIDELLRQFEAIQARKLGRTVAVAP